MTPQTWDTRTLLVNCSRGSVLSVARFSDHAFSSFCKTASLLAIRLGTGPSQEQRVDSDLTRGTSRVPELYWRKLFAARPLLQRQLLLVAHTVPATYRPLPLF